MDQKKCDAMFSDIKAAIREVEKKYGMIPSRFSGQWSSDGLKVHISMMEASSNAAVAAAEAGIRTDPKQLNHLKRHGGRFGLFEVHLGKQFKINGRTFVFSGMSSSQYAVGMDIVDKKYYRLNPVQVGLAFREAN